MGFSLLVITLLLVGSFLIQIVQVQLFNNIAAQLQSILLILTSSLLLIYQLVILQKLRIPPLLTSLLLLFLGWMSLSTVFSKDPATSIWELLRFFAYSMLFISIYNLVKDNPKTEKMLLWAVAVIFSVFLLRDLQIYVLKGNLVSGAYFMGLMAWHNQMGGFLLFLIPLLLALFLAAKSTLTKYIYLIMILISLGSLILTRSRGSWLSLVVAFMLFIFLNFKKINLKILGLIGAVVIIFTALFAIKPITNTEIAPPLYQEIMSKSRSVSGNVRVSQHESGLRLSSDYPFFGVGPGGFGLAITHYQTVPWLYSPLAHDYFLKVITELGIPGFLLFASIVVLSILTFVHQKGKITTSPLLWGVVLALAASLTHNLFDTDWYKVSLFAVFWIFLAIFWANFGPCEKTFKITSPLKMLLVVPLLMIVISFFLLESTLNYGKSLDSLQKGQYESAERSIAQALNFLPISGRYYFIYGQILASQGRILEAKVKYLQALKYTYFDADSRYSLGAIEYRLGNLQEAEKWLLEAIYFDPFFNPDKYNLLAEVYLASGKTENARSLLKAALENAFPLNRSYQAFEYIYQDAGLKPQLSNLYLQYINVQMIYGQKEEAEKWLKEAANLDPKNPFLASFSARIRR